MQQDGENVRHEIGSDIDGGADHHGRLDQRNIAQLQRIDQQRAEARIGKHPLDDDDTAWKLFGGYRFNPYISLELAYVDFGGPSDRATASGSSGDYKVELSGFAPYIIASYPLGPVEVFGKAGYYFYDIEVDADFDDLSDDVFDSDSSGDDFLYGFGVGMTFFDHLHARLEYEKIDADDVDDADALWLSGAWRF